MTRTFRSTRAVAITALTTMALAACGSSGAPGGNDGQPVSGGTFTVALNDDPGNLSPLTGVSLVQRGLVRYGYESLTYITPDGDVVPWLAESWEQTPTTVTFTLKPGITCADGTPFTAATAAANIAYQAAAENGTFWHGSAVAEGTTARAEGNRLVVTSPAPDPFLVPGTGGVELVCQAGLDDPATLTDRTNGTGLYTLGEAVPGASYTYTKRPGYTWGPDGVTSETVGLPDQIVGRVVTDEATATNLLLAGELNAASIAGTDRRRIESSGLQSVGVLNPIGEMLFNERPDRPTADERVRRALTLGLDRATVGELVTDGEFLEPVSLVNRTPLSCVAGGPRWQLPATDPAAAGALLDQAGWTAGPDGRRARGGTPLTIRFLYDGGTPSHGAAAEEVQQQWNALGITTELVAEDPAGWSTDLYQSYDWDTGFIQITPGSPVTLSLFFLGATSEQGGYNFMAVDNPSYEALAVQARSAPSTEQACELWQRAEAELIQRVDVYPLAETRSPTYMRGATFEMPGSITPTSIRMLG